MADALTFEQVFREELAEVEPALAAVGTTEQQLQAAIAATTEPLAALCLSGGGIRSAAFSLGVLQALTRFGVLGAFHFLSTVSGGGYIGSWLTAWRALGASNSEIFDCLVSPPRHDGKEVPEIQGLRADSNYLTPKRGLLSADTWTVAALYARNMALNWLVFGPLFMGLLMVPQIARFWLDLVHCWHLPWPFPLAWVGVGWLAAVVGLSGAVRGRLRARTPWITEGRFLARVLLPLVVSAAAFATLAASGGPEGPLWAVVLAGAAASALAYAAARAIGSRVKAPEGTGGRDAWLAWFAGGAATGAVLALGHGLSAQIGMRELAVFTVSWVMLCYAVGSAVFVALDSYAVRGDSDREWQARQDGWLLAAAATWAVVSGVALYGPVGVVWLDHHVRSYLATLTVSGLVTLAFGSGASTAATTAGKLTTWFSLETLVSVVGLLFAVCLAAGLSWANRGLLQLASGDDPLWCLLAAMVGCAVLLVLGVLLSWPVNVNRFSLHAVYRNRLARAFIGSARTALKGRPRQRKPDPFTGFDTKDNIRMARARPRRAADRRRLFHVINIAVNLVGTRNLAWQERKAEPFTVTHLHCGSARLGYRRTCDYGSEDGGITLGTAMAISGAAVSPNMGYHSSPLIGMLLMLFNIRLGAWLGNPKRDRYRKSGPVPGVSAALEELAGLTDDRNRWIYLSDGGHFDNLGLYEMVRRGCRAVVVVDAGCDPDYGFADLGNACRKIFIDFGISVRFDDLDLAPRKTPPQRGPYCARGTISYPGSDRDGWLLYIKPGFHGDEPPDVLSYAIANAAFPHQSTADQWFNESQFEAYRALGAHIVERICAGSKNVAPGANPPALDLESLKERCEEYLAAARLRPSPPSCCAQS